MKSYTRYGGIFGILGQTQPLTEEERKYDQMCQKIDDVYGELINMMSSKFTVAELVWLNQLSTKTWFFPQNDLLAQQLADLERLRQIVMERAL